MAISLPNTSLSANDTRILNALFDPETLPSSVARAKETTTAIDASLPAHPSIPAPQLSDLEDQQNTIITHISTISSPEAIDDAIAQVTGVLAAYPAYASAHVNRAMLRRMKIEATLPKDQHIFSASEPDIENLFTDLARAIHISSPASSASAPVSTYAARVLRTAYTHRAYLYLKAVETGTELKGMGKGELEELASRDFAAAARYGDEVAREMSVRTNPYAKMCGAIVRNALREERKGSDTKC